MNKHFTRIIGFVLCFLLLNPTILVQAGNQTYVTDEDENLVPVPNAYEVWGSIKNLGDSGFMNHAEDLYIDKEGYLYVADTENNRILKLDRSGIVIKEFTEAFGTNLKKPKGVYVHDDGNVWIADTGNLRLVVVDQEGQDVSTFGKPSSSLLDASFTFDPQKIFVNPMGYIYALKGANLMRMDQQNAFHGYIGASKVGFSLQRFLIRMFGSQAQVERTVKQEPTSYTNFLIGADGMIYGVLANEATNQIRRLNSVGNNTYPLGTYGLTIEMEGQTTPVKPFFSDLAVAENGIITLIDRNTGLIFQYDQQGNLLAIFGGIGEYQGTYQIPVSISVDGEGFLYILDYNTNTITILEPTEFIKLVHRAVTLHEEGNYTQAKEYWKKVLEIDSSYSLAHEGVAKVLSKEENWSEAVREYRLADDKEGYSKAFSEKRHENFRSNFGLVVGGFAIGLMFISKIFWYTKKQAKHWAYKVEMGGDL